MSTNSTEKQNLARWSVEHRQVAWVLLIAALLGGIFGYQALPKRKDPNIPVRAAVVTCAWPGMSAPKVEELVLHRIEGQIATNRQVKKLQSTALAGLAIVEVYLKDEVPPGAMPQIWDDIELKLKQISNLPEGAGPIGMDKDFGDTATVMLTVASPKVSGVDLEIRARELQAAIEEVRARGLDGGAPRRNAVSVAFLFPDSTPPGAVDRATRRLMDDLRARSLMRAPRRVVGRNFVVLDGSTGADDASLRAGVRQFLTNELHESELHPDVWPLQIIRRPQDTQSVLAAAPGDRYSYRELDDFTDLIERTLRGKPVDSHQNPIVSRVTRTGILDQRVWLTYSQERLASYGINVDPSQVLSARNVPAAGGVLEAAGRNLRVSPSGEFRTTQEIGDVMLAGDPGRGAVYLRDVAEIQHGYDTPARFLNDFTYRDSEKHWRTSRAVTMALFMRDGAQVAEFGNTVNATLASLRRQLPPDLIIERTSDQPRQVEENLELFNSALIEAVVLVVLVSLIGFWDWRTALLLGVSIPVTLLLTFAVMVCAGLDVQQVSTASLIIALGLLVDVPVVACDAIKRLLGEGHKPKLAAWLGPTALGTAMLFATITNIVAYAPLAGLSGDTGRFIFSLPVVIGISLAAALLVSKTLVPLMAFYFLKAGKPQPPIEELRQQGFFKHYVRFVGWCVDHRRIVSAVSVLLLVLGGLVAHTLKTSFFPIDRSYFSYVELMLPNDASIASTRATSSLATEVITRVTAEHEGRHQPAHSHKSSSGGLLKSVTAFVGAPAPRFWQTIVTERAQPSYAMLLIELTDPDAAYSLVGSWQEALTREVPGARLVVKQLQTGTTVLVPAAYRLKGPDHRVLRAKAEELKSIFRQTPLARQVRDDWGTNGVALQLDIDPDRANLAGVTNLDVVRSTAAAMSGLTVGTLRVGRFQIPIVGRMQVGERAQLSDLGNLYVYSTSGSKVPLSTVARVAYTPETAKIKRHNQTRCIEVGADPAPGHLYSEIMEAVGMKVAAWEKTLPSGYWLETSGTLEEQNKGFGDLTLAMLISIALIYLSLVFQFEHAVKPIIVFAAVPFGVVGALIALGIMDSPFGFMAFLGVVSLIGVIVSHIIVLFDFIEEGHAEGRPLREALLDAGVMRLRPVLITVLATVLGLFPLAMHGGPLWEPLCYVQIGGLLLSTLVTLVLVPVIYTVFVRDLKWVQWETSPSTSSHSPSPTKGNPPAGPSSSGDGHDTPESSETVWTGPVHPDAQSLQLTFAGATGRALPEQPSGVSEPSSTLPGATTPELC